MDAASQRAISLTKEKIQCTHCLLYTWEFLNVDAAYELLSIDFNRLHRFYAPLVLMSAPKAELSDEGRVYVKC